MPPIRLPLRYTTKAKRKPDSCVQQFPRHVWVRAFDRIVCRANPQGHVPRLPVRQHIQDYGVNIETGRWENIAERVTALAG